MLQLIFYTIYFEEDIYTTLHPFHQDLHYEFGPFVKIYYICSVRFKKNNSPVLRCGQKKHSGTIRRPFNYKRHFLFLCQSLVVMLFFQSTSLENGFILWFKPYCDISWQPKQPKRDISIAKQNIENGPYSRGRSTTVGCEATYIWVG